MQNIREVYSLLVPIDKGRLIMPRAAIAEVTGFTKPKDRPEGAPDFLLGFIEWQKQKIPLVSFEAACGKKVPETGRRSRIAIVFGIEGRLKNPNAFALVTQGYPYLVRVNEGVLRLEEMEDGDEDAPVLVRTRMANERPKIPDLGRIEIMIADALGISAEDEDSSEPADELDELDALAVGEDDSEDGLLDLGGDSDDEEINLDDISFDVDEDASDSDDDDFGLDDLLGDDDKA